MHCSFAHFYHPGCTRPGVQSATHSQALSAQFLPLKNAPLLLLLYLAAIVLQNAHDPKILPFKKLLSSATIYFSLQEMKQSHVFNSMRVQLHILD